MKMPRGVPVLLFCLLSFVPAFAQEKSAISGAKELDKNYIREHYPEIFQQIYMEGKEAGLKEAETKGQGAQKEAGSGEVKKEIAAQGRPDLGDWWNRSSLKYTPRPAGTLFHGELQYDYKRETGNIDSYSHRGAGKLVIRKDRFTNYLSYFIDKKISDDFTSGSHYQRDYKIFEGSLRYDLREKLYSEAGLIWETDSANLIKNRYVYYGGLGYNLLDMKDHSINVFLAYSRVKEEFDPLIGMMLGIDNRESNAAYFFQSYDWHVTDRLTFREKFRIIRNLDDSILYNMATGVPVPDGDTKRYMWVLYNALEYRINNFLSLVNSYQINYDSNPWPTVLKKDSTFSLGVKFGF